MSINQTDIIINDMKFEVNYQQKLDKIRFFIKNLKNGRFMESYYSPDNNKFVLSLTNKIPSVFDQNILLLSSININKLGDDINYAFCEMDFARIINDIYLGRNQNYTSGFSLLKDTKGEIVSIIDNNNKIILNSLSSLYQFYMSRTPKFTFDDFKKAIEKYKETFKNNPTFLYNIIIDNEDKLIRNSEFFDKMLERLRIKAILELSIWRTKLEDYKKKIRDTKGEIISRDPIKYFQQILNPFNLEELVNIGVNYSDRYKELLEEKYQVLTYTGNDYKDRQHIYTEEEKELILKLEDFLKLESRIDKNLAELERKYQENLLFITNMKKRVKSVNEELKKLNLKEQDLSNKLNNFRENWEIYLIINDRYEIEKSELKKVIYENDRLIVEIIKDKIKNLNTISEIKEFLSDEDKDLLKKLIDKYQTLLTRYTNITKYFEQLDRNNILLLENINKFLINYVDNLIKELDITIILKNGNRKNVRIDSLDILDLNNIQSILLPKLDRNIELFINPFTFEINDKSKSCRDNLGTLKSILEDNDKCYIKVNYSLLIFSKNIIKGDLIISSQIQNGIAKFLLNQNTKFVRIRMTNLLQHIIKLKYSSYLYDKYSGEFDNTKRTQLLEEVEIINNILSNSNIEQIELSYEKEDVVKRERIVESEISLDPQIIYRDLNNKLIELHSHPRYLEIAFFLELYLIYFQYNPEKDYIIKWIDYIIKLNDNIDQSLLLISELDKITFNIKLKFQKTKSIREKELSYTSNINIFNNFIKELNDFIDIEKLVISKNLKIRLKQLLTDMKLAEYENYNKLKLYSNQIFKDGSGLIDYENIDKITQHIELLNDDSQRLDIDELKYIKDLLNQLENILKPYTYDERIETLLLNINKLNTKIDKKITSDEAIVFILSQREIEDTRRIKTSKEVDQSKLLKKLLKTDFITVFKIIKENKTNKITFNLLSDRQTINVEQLQRGGDRTYQTRDFYLLRDKVFYDRELKTLYDSIPDKIKKYEIIILPKRNTLKLLNDNYQKIKDYYNRVKISFKRGKDKIEQELRNIKDLIKTNVRKLNPYELDLNSANIDKIEQLEMQKISFPFEINYIHYQLDLRETNRQFLDSLTKKLIEFVKSNYKLNIYREKSIEYKIINNQSYDYNYIIGEIERRYQIESIPIIKLLPRKDTKLKEQGKLLKLYKELYQLEYLRFDEIAGLGASKDRLETDIQEIKIDDIDKKEISKKALELTFRNLLKEINFRIRKIVLKLIEDEIEEPIFKNNQVEYQRFIEMIRKIKNKLLEYNIILDEANIYIENISKDIIAKIGRSTPRPNKVLLYLLNLYNIELRPVVERKEIEIDNKPRIIIKPKIKEEISKHKVIKYKLTVGKDVLDILPEYQKIDREKVNINDEEYQAKNIIGNYKSGKYYYYVVDNVNIIPKYKQKQNSKKIEPIIEISLEDKININNLLIVKALLDNPREIIIPFRELIVEKRLENKENNYYLLNIITYPKDYDENKLLLCNLILLLIENYKSIYIDNKYPDYFETLELLKQKYSGKIINIREIMDILNKFVLIIAENIYRIIPNVLIDKYFIQQSERNKVVKYNFELLIDYIINVIKLQQLRDGNILITPEQLLVDFTQILVNSLVINKEVLVDKLIRLNKKMKSIVIPNYVIILNNIASDNKIKNIKQPRLGRILKKINSIKNEFERKNKVKLEAINKTNKLITERIDNLLERFDNITESEINDIEPLIIKLEEDVSYISQDIDKNKIITELLQIR